MLLWSIIWWGWQLSHFRKRLFYFSNPLLTPFEPVLNKSFGLSIRSQMRDSTAMKRILIAMASCKISNELNLHFSPLKGAVPRGRPYANKPRADVWVWTTTTSSPSDSSAADWRINFKNCALIVCITGTAHCLFGICCDFWLIVIFLWVGLLLIKPHVRVKRKKVDSFRFLRNIAWYLITRISFST